MLRQTLALAFVLLLVAFSLEAADPLHEATEADTAPSIERADIVASSTGDDALMAALFFDGSFNDTFDGSFDATFAAAGAGDAGFGSCYTACYPPLDGLCTGGQVAEATVKGPTSSCALVDFRCVDRCSGPLVRCNQFAAGCYDF